MAKAKQEARPEDLVDERGVPFAEHVWSLRRNPDEAGHGPRWSVFRDNEFAPVGFLEGHACPMADGAPGLIPYRLDGRPLTVAKPGRDDLCLPNLRNALISFEFRVGCTEHGHQGD